MESRSGEVEIVFETSCSTCGDLVDFPPTTSWIPSTDCTTCSHSIVCLNTRAVDHQTKTLSDIPQVTRLTSRGLLVNWWLRGLMGRWVHVVAELNMMFWNSWIEHVMRQRYSSYDEVSKYCSFDGSLNIDCWTNIPWFEQIFIIWASVAHVMNCWIFDRLSMCCSSDGLLAAYQKY